MLLAVSELSDIYTEDQPFINQMELLISNFTARRYNRAENWENVELCDQQYKHYKHMNRHYVLTKYFMEDIKNVKIEDRCVYLINIYTFLHRYLTHLYIFLHNVRAFYLFDY